MTRERSDVSYRKKLRAACAVGLSIQMAFEAIDFNFVQQPRWWTFNRLHGEAA